jgi:hypothetical protein
MISVPDVDPAGALVRLAGFSRCLTARADALFQLVDAVLYGDTPARSLVELSLAGAHRRGHGAMYAGLDCGRIDVARLRTALAAVPVLRAADGRIVLAVDVTCWLRPEAHTSAQRVLCHTYGRTKDTHIGVPGRPYSVVVGGPLLLGPSGPPPPVCSTHASGAVSRPVLRVSSPSRRCRGGRPR